MPDLEPSAAAFRPTVPRIAPVPPGVKRPEWSVMIPTYNCAALLRETLASVLQQAPSADEMQIMVVDDHSTQDDPEAVVRELGNGRVQFFRQPQNVGVTRNFNTCLEKSTGRRLHILHGDDLVLPGFYASIRKAESHFPQAALIATRTFTINEQGALLGISERCETWETFNSQTGDLLTRNCFFFPGVTLSRSFVESHGGFDTQFAHVADWEMWLRAIRCQGGLSINQPLASYRIFAANDTSRLKRTAQNLEDALRLSHVLQSEIEDYPREAFMASLRSGTRDQIMAFKHRQDWEAVKANRAFWRKIVSPVDFVKLAIMAIVNRLRSI